MALGLLGLLGMSGLLGLLGQCGLSLWRNPFDPLFASLNVGADNLYIFALDRERRLHLSKHLLNDHLMAMQLGGGDPFAFVLADTNT